MKRVFQRSSSLFKYYSALRKNLLLASVLLILCLGGMYTGCDYMSRRTSHSVGVLQTDVHQSVLHTKVHIPTTRVTITPSESPSNTSSGICKFPEIDPFDLSIEKHLVRYVPLNCSFNIPNVVRLDNDEIIIDSAKVEEALVKTHSSGEFGYCQYKVLHRNIDTDRDANVVWTSAKFNTSINLDEPVEDIKVECYDTEGKMISRSYFAIIRLDPEKQRIYDDSYKVHREKHSPAETLSILMIGIDGFAKQHFARTMPKTRDFLIKELGALELNKHSKLGYSTWPNVIPLLTGRTSEELKNDDPWRYQTSDWMDKINEAFVWSDARRLGYRTGLMFDVVHFTAFHWLKKGFRRRPVDHYMRSIVADSIGDPLMREGHRHCFGDEPEISKLGAYWLQLLHRYNSTRSNKTPFFAYSFFSRLTHDDYNLAFGGDEVYLKYLQDLKATNALNNTIILWFSDHGERFGPLRHTFTGEVETNTPYFFFVFPPWFEKKYPEVMQVFKTNQDRLTSFHDIYPTLQDILYFKGVVGPKGNRGERGISLFREIPLHRTCEDAQIPAEYCLCSNPSLTNLDPNLERYLGTVLKDKIVDLLGNRTDVCSTLSLGSVERILEENSPTGPLGSRSSIRVFRVNIMTVPGEAQFQARLSFNTSLNLAEVKGEIARTNMYRGQSDCVDTVELRRYCFCKNLLPNKDE